MLTRALQRLSKTIRRERLQQIIQRVDIESPQGMFLVTGCENYGRPPLARYGVENCKTVLPGHIHIYERKLGRVTFNGGNRLNAGAFRDDSDGPVPGEPKADAFSGPW